jgi:hypothetical protein
MASNATNTEKATRETLAPNKLCLLAGAIGAFEASCFTGGADNGGTDAGTTTDFISPIMREYSLHMRGGRGAARTACPCGRCRTCGSWLREAVVENRPETPADERESVETVRYLGKLSMQITNRITLIDNAIDSVDRILRAIQGKFRLKNKSEDSGINASQILASN